ncbi:hypothetical protein DFH09DRAFT_1069685 [Mycena vulgaris]|nr:hypothetical protein DFH09DRAFT_1069685 [Mycena vulgaris]
MPGTSVEVRTARREARAAARAAVRAAVRRANGKSSSEESSDDEMHVDDGEEGEPEVVDSNVWGGEDEMGDGWEDMDADEDEGDDAKETEVSGMLYTISMLAVDGGGESNSEDEG